MSEEMIKDEKPGHREAATVAGLQFVLGIGIAIAILIPVLVFVLVLLPMGWGAVWPTIIMVVAILLGTRVGWIVYKKGKE